MYANVCTEYCTSGISSSEPEYRWLSYSEILLIIYSFLLLFRVRRGQSNPFGRVTRVDARRGEADLDDQLHLFDLTTHVVAERVDIVLRMWQWRDFRQQSLAACYSIPVLHLNNSRRDVTKPKKVNGEASSRLTGVEACRDG